MDYERVNERLQEKLGSLTDAHREMTTKVDAANADLRQAKVATNEEKSAKIFAERRLKEQAKRLEELEAELIGEQAAHEKHVDEYKQLCKKLSDTLEDMTKDNVEKEQFGVVADRARTNLELENNRLKEELTGKTTQLHSHKESNFKLTQGIEDAIRKIEERDRAAEELQLKMDAESRILAEQMTKHEGTIAQQTKLIDFLQTKVSLVLSRL